MEGFPEDHVTDYIHKLPHIAEIGYVAILDLILCLNKCYKYNSFCNFHRTTSDRDITNDFLIRERDEQLKRETVQTISTTTIPLKGEMMSDIKKSVKYEDMPDIYSKETTSRHTVTTRDEPSVITEITTTSRDVMIEQKIETVKQTSSERKFDVKKIRTDTLGKFDIDDIEPKDTKRCVPKDLDLKETSEITKEQVKPVIDDILQKGTTAAAARISVLDKDVKQLFQSMDVVESEKRSYDAKAPHKEERRHSCISPAISLERIAESDVETEEDIDKFVSSVPETQKGGEIKETTIKKSDSHMKQMADNIEIIIKQASEDVDLSSEELAIEPLDPKDISGQVSVDSIIEEAVNTVEEYLVSSKEAKEKEIQSKKDDVVFEESKKFAKERPGLMKSLSRDSGEIVIMPKKKHPRTFSVQSSPDEVEEQIYTDSESGMFL